MLSLASGPGSFKLAHSLDGKDAIHVVPGSESDPPMIQDPNPQDLLTDKEWMRAISKYKMTKKTIRALKSCWLHKHKCAELGDDPKAAMAMVHLEKIMIRKMKKNYRIGPGSSSLLPHVSLTEDNLDPSSFFICGSTSCGKDFFANQLLLDAPEGRSWVHNRPIVMFVMDESDPSTAAMRKKYSKNLTIIDLSKLEGVRSLPLSIIPPGALLYTSDVLSALDRQDPIRQAVLETLKHASIRGRHATGKRGLTKRGVELITCVHSGSLREYASLRNSCKWMVFFPRSCRNVCRKLLRSRFDYKKSQVDSILDRCKDSRWAAFRMRAPLCMVHQKGCMMLDDF